MATKLKDLKHGCYVAEAMGFKTQLNANNKVFSFASVVLPEYSVTSEFMPTEVDVFFNTFDKNGRPSKYGLADLRAFGKAVGCLELAEMNMGGMGFELKIPLNGRKCYLFVFEREYEKDGATMSFTTSMFLPVGSYPAIERLIPDELDMGSTLVKTTVIKDEKLPSNTKAISELFTEPKTTQLNGHWSPPDASKGEEPF